MIPQPTNVEESRREAGLQPHQPPRARLAHAVDLFSRYWLSKDWPFAWGALVALLTVNFGAIYIAVWSNAWQQRFYDAIQNRAGALFLTLVTSFTIILVSQVGQSIASTALTQWLGIRWRTFLTDHYLGRWFAHDRYYEIERLRLIDNPDQRIAADLGLFSGSVLDNVLGVISSLVSAVTFSVILFRTAEPIRFAMFGHAITIPGDTVWYGWLYALAGAAAITWVGRSYVRRSMRAQHYEADFRAGLLHVRRDAAQIALAGAQAPERRGLDQAYGRVRANFHRLILANIGLNVGQGIYERVGTILPLFLTVPRYFAGAISFGQVMAAKDAFEQLTGSLSYFVQAYGQIGGQIANVNRLKALDDALDHERPRGIAFAPGGTGEGVAIRVEGLELRRPDGAPLLTLPVWRVGDGERWMIEGPSGAGKSTLLRAIAGLWPDGAGRVEVRGHGTVMMVPQRLYLPLGTLKDAACFPDPAETHGDGPVLDLLDRVGLSVHVGHLHAARMWADELSPGEQQRLALARILLHRPDLLILDEATSALDHGNARGFHETLLAELPRVTMVSVVHDERLAAYHTHRLTIADGRVKVAA